jgi:DNA-directed RNA polymerase specialized sigma24 family protein
VSFRALPDHELDRRDDGALLAYVRGARAAGDRDAARRALQLIVFGYWDVVAARVALRVPAHAVDDVAADVIVRAVGSAFAGDSVGELRAWLGTILGRTVADYYRARERSLPGGERFALAEPPGTEAPDGYVAARMLVEQALEELRPDHRRVVEIVVFADRPAAEACAEVPGMTGANAYQIVKRFRWRLRTLLEESEHG